MSKKWLMLSVVIISVFVFIAMVNPNTSIANPDGSKGYTCSACHPGKADQTPPSTTKPTITPKTTTTKTTAPKTTTKKVTAPKAPTFEVANVTVEGKAVKSYMYNKTVYTAVYEYAKAMGYNYAWNSTTKIASLSDYNSAVELNAAKNLVKYRGKDTKVSMLLKDSAYYVDIAAITSLTKGKIKYEGKIFKVRKSSKHVGWEESGHNFDLTASQSSQDTCVTCHNGLAFPDKKTFADVKSQKAPVGCNTCHGATKDPKDLKGKNPFKAASGLTIDAGVGTICINCHNGRRNVSDAKTLYETAKAPHRGPQAEIFFGFGGMELGGMAYDKSPHSAIEDTCVTCHMAPAADTYGPVGDHTFKVGADGVNNMNACTDCHPGLTTVNRRALGDYDGDKVLEGIQDEVEGLIHLLETALIDKYAAKGVTQLGDVHGIIYFITDNTNAEEPEHLAFTAVSQNDYKAAWNLFVIEDDGSEGIHNPAYVIQLLQRSYKSVTGNDVPNAVIR